MGLSLSRVINCGVGDEGVDGVLCGGVGGGLEECLDYLGCVVGGCFKGFVDYGRA